MSTKSNLVNEVKQMLKEQNMEYLNNKVLGSLVSIVENETIGLLKDAKQLKNNDEELNKNDILLAIALNNEEAEQCEIPDEASLTDIINKSNSKPITIKDMCGIKLPKENLGNCNYQLENPNKKIKIEATHKYDGYGNKQFGNCFTFLMPPKPYKSSPNLGSFVIKNSQANHEMPMKITIRPKFNTQQNNISMLKKDFHHR